MNIALRVETAASPMALHSALIPVPKLESDCYDWYQRHADVLALQQTIRPEIVVIGDSITHFWGGLPVSLQDGVPISFGPEAWAETFGDTPVLNLGFGWDRTQNVLWRLENGQLDGLSPRLIMLLIGTNNLTGTANAGESTPEEIADGIVAIHATLREKCPEAHILVMGVLPRGLEPGTPMRAAILAVNESVKARLSGRPDTSFLDIGTQLLDEAGTLPLSIAPDGTHLNEAGYRIWGAALRDFLIPAGR